MSQVSTSDLKELDFHLTMNGFGSVPLHGAKFKASVIRGNGTTAWEFDDSVFSVEEPGSGVFRMKAGDDAINSIREDGDTMTLVVYGAIDGENHFPVCKRRVLDD